jgi:hypothetical protein
MIYQVPAGLMDQLNLTAVHGSKYLEVDSKNPFRVLNKPHTIFSLPEKRFLIHSYP